jgi:hypothetical protein
MKNLFFLLFFVAFHSIASFSGHWVNDSNSQSLTLDLIEKGNDVYGRYCFITNNGNRIDCAESGDVNIKGVVKNNVGIVIFESIFGGSGKATLSIIDGILSYAINDYSPFVEANMSVPKVISFKKTTEVPAKIKAVSTECKDTDVLIASCHFSGVSQRVATFCLNKKNSVIECTFQKNNKKELNVSFSLENKLKRWVDLGTNTTYFGFNKGGYSYILIIPEEKPNVVALLDIKQNGIDISTNRCDSNSFGERNIKSNSIEDVPDEIVRSNNFKFP